MDIRVAVTLVIAICAVLSGAPAFGREYYVDFDGGSDQAVGTSPGAAFKHCPGDAEATGRAQAATLQPGDTVIFKGGVHYRSTVTIPFSGAPGRPLPVWPVPASIIT